MAKPKSPTPEEFYCAVGRATTAWQLVEEALCDLFTRLVTWHLLETAKPTGQSTVILGLIFYSSTNLRARIEMLEKILVRTVRDEALLTEWNTITNRMGRLYTRRNTLAHSHAWGPATAPEMLSPSIFVPDAKNMNYLQILAAEDSFKRNAKRIEDYTIAVNHYLVPRGAKGGA